MAPQGSRRIVGHQRARVYLDWNATAPLKPAARAAALAALDLGGNPSSVHRPGRAARRLLEEAREAVLVALGLHLPPGPATPRVVFTSGATEANGLALTAASAGGPLLVSALEHPSVDAAAGAAERIPALPGGPIDLDWLDQRLRRGPPPALVSVMAVNNETGVIQPVAAAAALVRAAGARLHVDAVQLPGRLALSWAALDADLVTLSGHKIGAPPGCGVLVAAAEVPLAPVMRGGGQEGRLRAGTENLPGIAGFAAALADLPVDLAAMPAVTARRDRLERALCAAAPDAVVVGAGAPRIGNTLCLALPGSRADVTVMRLDLGGVAASAGAACSSGRVEPSRVLSAMGLPPALAGAAVRFSLGPTTTDDDVATAVAVWQEIVARRAAA